MSTELLPRLPQHEASWPELQVWWQQVCEKVERIVADLQSTDAELAATQAELADTQDDLADAVDVIEQILVDLGYATLTAEGALTLAESAINPGGTIKTDKVLTTSIAPSNVTRVDVALQVGTSPLVTTGTETTLLTNTVDAIPAGATGIEVKATAYFDDPSDNTLKARFRLYKNGVEVAKDFKRNDGTSNLIEIDLAPVAGDVWHSTYTREGEDFYVSKGQLFFTYFDR